MLLTRVMYYGLLEQANEIEKMMSRLPHDFTDINIIQVSPTVGRRSSVDIYPLEGEFTKENVTLPERARKFADRSADTIVEFFYGEGTYRIFPKKDPHEKEGNIEKGSDFLGPHG